jgi:hypothetical protein
LSSALRNLLGSASALAAGAGIWIAFAHVGAGGATPTAATSKNMNPFGAPTGNGDFKVPSPPEQPTLVPTIGTKTTQRL